MGRELNKYSDRLKLSIKSMEYVEGDIKISFYRSPLDLEMMASTILSTQMQYLEEYKKTNMGYVNLLLSLEIALREHRRNEKLEMILNNK